MIRLFGLSAIFAILALPGFAQKDSVQTNGAKSPRKSSHYVGLQANQLIKQLLNLGGSTSAINNPYLITYSVNSNKSGVGLNLSLGYTRDESLSTSGDGANQIQTTINEFFFRVGVEKKRQIGKRWLLTAGGDVVVDNESNKTESRTTFGSGNPQQTSTNKEKSFAYGTGLRVGLNFHITDKVLLGTEATYYLKRVAVTNTSSSSFGTPKEAKQDLTKFQLNVPAVLFLIVKL
jgi:hypothetical protein